MFTVSLPAIPAATLSLASLKAEDVSTRAEASLLLFAQDALLLAGSRLYAPIRGDVVLLPPHTPARLCFGKDVSYGKQLSLSDTLLRILLPELLLQAANGGILLSLGERESARLCMAMAALENAEALSFFSLLSVIKGGDTVTELRERPLPVHLRRALLWLLAHPDDPADTEALASRCGVSRSTLLRAFRAHIAITPKDYRRLVQSAAAGRPSKIK